MQDFKVRPIQSTADAKERSRRLAQVYSTILLWPDPRETETESFATDLGRNEATDSADGRLQEQTSINSTIMGNHEGSDIKASASNDANGG